MFWVLASTESIRVLLCTSDLDVPPLQYVMPWVQESLLTIEFLIYFSEKKSKPIEGMIARVPRELIADLGRLPSATVLTLLLFWNWSV